MKKTIMLILPVVLLAACGGAGGKKCDGKPQLTDEQKACLKKQGCPKPEFKKGEEVDKAAKEKFMKCKTKAFEACKIEKIEKKKDK